MSDSIESNGFFARRRTSGSQISFNDIYGGYPEQALLYENKVLGLRIRFPVLYIRRKFSVLNAGQPVEQPITVGIILARGGLKLEIERKLDSSTSSDAAAEVIRDVYEVLLELFRNSPVRSLARIDTSEVPLHIYEVESDQFWDAVNHGPPNRNYCPDVIAKWSATLVA